MTSTATASVVGRTRTRTRGGAGVAEHVGQRLLHDPVARGLHSGRELRSPATVDVDRHAGGAQAADELVELVQPAVRLHGAGSRAVAQHAERRAQVGERLARSRLDAAQRRAGLLGVTVDEMRGDAGLHVDRDHRVGDVSCTSRAIRSRSSPTRRSAPPRRRPRPLDRFAARADSVAAASANGRYATLRSTMLNHSPALSATGATATIAHGTVMRAAPTV